jgi:hypothetical protein
MAFVSEAEYKGNPMIVLKNSPEDPQPFQFGVRKARMLLAHLEDIRRFIQKHEQ